MYRAVLLCSVGVVLATGSPLHLLLLVSLAVVLRGKARFEEQGLRALHPDYSKYSAVTPAIVGWVPDLDWR